MKPASLLAVLFTAGCSHITAPPRPKHSQPASQEAAIQAAKDDLRSLGIEPGTKRLTIIGSGQTKGWFDRQPPNDYWERGKAAVNKSPFYIVSFSEPGLTLGGVHLYFIHAETHRCLWIGRAR